jgi:hypothetical protein
MKFELLEHLREQVTDDLTSRGKGWGDVCGLCQYIINVDKLSFAWSYHMDSPDDEAESGSYTMTLADLKRYGADYTDFADAIKFMNGTK